VEKERNEVQSASNFVSFDASVTTFVPAPLFPSLPQSAPLGITRTVTTTRRSDEAHGNSVAGVREEESRRKKNRREEDRGTEGGEAETGRNDQCVQT
jgi:hypothetical protein